MNTETKKEKKTKEKMYLEGRDALIKEEIIESHEVIWEIKNDPMWGRLRRVVSDKVIGEEINKRAKFSLKEVEDFELTELRKSGIPGFVLKEEGKYYYAEVEEDIGRIGNLLGKKHRCVYENVVCQHLSAASDEDGGCAKIREYSNRIEKYDWITVGYETFNTNQDAFVVVECLHYEKCKSRPKKILNPDENN